MERYHRKTPLKVLKIMWLVIRESNGQEIEHTRLVKQLQKVFTSAGDQIESYVTNAVVDNLIQVVDNPKRPKPKSVYHYTLPDITDFSFPDEHPDVYCYECHLEGSVQKCADCLRVFHRECVKTLAEKHAKMEEYVTKYKRVNISDFGVSDVHLAGCATPVPTVASPPVDANENHTTSADAQIATVKDELDIKQEEDCKPSLMTSDEPQFVGVVRQADRRLGERLNTPTIKPEDNSGGTNIMDSEEIILKYCYPCRQTRGNLFNTPPNMSKGELNYLLRFVFEEYKSWLPNDTYSPTRQINNRPRVSEVVDNMDLCKTLLLRRPISMDTIQQKIEDTKYERLEEFCADILDIAHNIGVIYGSTSLEYNAVMYFVTDCVYDLFEIRQCPDCFRHSNEKAEPDWFARPCNTRHELVFAKHKGYQYWPAKVIRVVNNKYDVRFFGDKHSRAVVDAAFVKPIDTDFAALKVNPKKPGFPKAMEELHKHVALSSLPKDHYAYGNQPAGPIDVVLRNAGMGEPINFTATPVPTIGPKKRGRKPKAQTRKTIDLLGDSSSSASESFDQISQQSSSFSSGTLHGQTPNSVQGSGDKRTTRQMEKRPSEPTGSNEHSPVSSKRLRLAEDIVPLNGLSSSTAISPARSNGSISLGSGPSNESLTPRSPRIKAQMKRQYSDDVVKLKALMEKMDNIDKVKQLAADALQEDINRWQQKLRSLVKEYTARLSEVKKKQWCKSCEHESILHCCWNTSYCSRDCQEKDWPTHKKLHKFYGKQQQQQQ